MNVEEYNALKHVLFGNQKQANVINDAVVGIVGEKLKGLNYSWDSEDAIINVIKDMLNNAINAPGAADEELVKLVAGDMSCNNLHADDVMVLTVDQPNPESPKHNFRIMIFGSSEQILQPDTNETIGIHMVPATTEPVATDDDYPARVREIKSKLLPLVPTAVKNALSDETEQCLCIAEYYYKGVGQCL